MLNMLVTCEHWRPLTLTHVEGKVGVGLGGPAVLRKLLAVWRVSEPRMTAASGSRKVPLNPAVPPGDSQEDGVRPWGGDARRSPMAVTRPSGEGARRPPAVPRRSPVAVVRPSAEGARWSTVAGVRP